MSFKNLKVERIEGELAIVLSKQYPLHKPDFVKIGEKKWFLPYKYVEEDDKIYNFEIRSDDTWIVSYPRTDNIMYTNIGKNKILGPGKSSWRFRSQFFNQKPQKFFTDDIMALLEKWRNIVDNNGRAMMPSVKNFCGFWLKNCDRKRHELFPGPNIYCTTVTQELVWLVANDMNFDEAHRKYLVERFPFIERAILDNHIVTKDIPGRYNTEKYSINFVRDQPSPRFIKSHMPLELLPTVVNSTCKIIYVARNPKDVAVSWYHFQKNLMHFQYQGTFEQFCNNFMNDHTLWSPYWEHVKNAWTIRHRANMMFLFYEDLIKDLSGNIKKIAAFFGKTYNDDQIAKLVEHLKIENFRKNPMVNQLSFGIAIQPDQFIRQGTTGNWKKIFTPQIEERFNKWIADNLKDTDLTFSD